MCFYMNMSFAEDVMTQSEYAQCQQRKYDLEQVKQQFHQRIQKNQQKKNELIRLEGERLELSEKIDYQSDTSVNHYNQLNEKLNELSKDYKQTIEQFNLDVEQFQKDVTALLSECNNKQYLLEKK